MALGGTAILSRRRERATACPQPAAVPPVPALYCTRRIDRDDLEYVGQTGHSLRRPLGTLRAGACGAVMPYRGPHTAALALWALRHSEQAEWEFSVSIVALARQNAMTSKNWLFADVQYIRESPARRAHHVP